MKRLILFGPKTMFQLAKALNPIRLVKTGQKFLSHISSDMGKKEYPVFVEPIKRRLPNRFKYGSSRALMPLSNTDGATEAVGTPESVLDPSPGELSVTEESVDQSSENVQDSASDLDQKDGPVKMDSETAAPSDNTRVRAANAPFFRTMVEAVPDSPASEGGLSDILSEDLRDIFHSVDYTNARTKALVQSREHVDVYELAKELDEYARSIGAVPETR